MEVKVKRKQPVYKYNDFKHLTSETAFKYMKRHEKSSLKRKVPPKKFSSPGAWALTGKSQLMWPGAQQSSLTVIFSLLRWLVNYILLLMENCILLLKIGLTNQVQMKP